MVQLDLFPETVPSPEKAADERVEIYYGLWKAQRRPASLVYLQRAIQDRLALEPLEP